MSQVPPAWSFSSLKLFSTCPKKYEAEKVTKEVKFTETEATLYGTALHKAAEDYMTTEEPLDPRFIFIKPYLDKLKAIEGEKLCELKLGVKRVDGRLEACDFFSPQVWFRGVADLVIINGALGWVIDYKTSKNARYADINQLALMAAALFLKYPMLEKIKTSLLFVVSKDFIKKDFKKETGLSIFAELNEPLTARTAAYENGVFNPKPNGLCGKYCEVLSCGHNGRNN
jgi:hypothetical protein